MRAIKACVAAGEFFREYNKRKQIPVWLLIVYGEQDRQSFHPPEYCYLGGGGTELLSKKTERLEFFEEPLDVNALLFKMPDHKQLVYYWYAAGKKMTASYYKQQFFFVLEQMKGRKTGGALIRVSTVVPEGESEGQASERISDFLNEALPEIKKIL